MKTMKVDITTYNDISEGYESYMDLTTGKIERRKHTPREMMEEIVHPDADASLFPGDSRSSMMQMNQEKP